VDADAFTPPEVAPSLIQLPSLVATTAEEVATPSMPSLEEDDTFCLVQGVADTMRIGQSYKSIGFEKERAIVGRALADRSK
jgi:hypothetical protein